MSRRDLAVVIGIAAACGALVVGLSFARRTGPRSVLAAAPGAASIVASIDAPALLASPIWQALAQEDEGGLGRIEEACGFDPLERVRTVAIYVIGTEDRPFERLGFVARGDVARGEAREELVRCVERVVGEDGGSIRRVEIEGVPAIASAHGSSRAAFVGDDGVVGGDESIVRAVIRAEHGEDAGADRDGTLAALWQRVQDRGDVIAVARVPSNWREWLGRIGGEVDLAALEGVSALGLGARIRSGLAVTLALETASEDAARDLVRDARDRTLALTDDPLLRASALGAALRRLELRSDRRTVIATVDLDAERLEALVQLARDQLARRRAAIERRRARALGAEVPAPDETVRPAGDEPATE